MTIKEDIIKIVEETISEFYPLRGSAYAKDCEANKISDRMVKKINNLFALQEESE